MDISDIVLRYTDGDSINSIASRANVCYSVVRRILITEGVPLRDCPQADIIIAMHDNGMDVKEIASALNLKVKTVMAYMPYTKGSYSVGSKSLNAQRIAACRSRKVK